MKISQKFHQTLQKQIKKHLGNKGIISRDLKDLLLQITKTYSDFDKNQQLLETTLSLNTKEFLKEKKLLKRENSKILKEAKINSKKLLSEVVVKNKILDEKILKLNETIGERRAVIESSGAGVVTVDKNGNVISINKIGLKNLGYKENELLGKKFTDIVQMQNEQGEIIPEKSRPLVKALISKKYKYSDINYFVRKNGTRFPIVVKVNPVHLDHKFAGAVNFFMDISAFKERSDQLLENEFFFKESQEAARIGSYRTDFIAGFWESSPTLDKIFGIDKKYIRNVSGWSDLIHPDDRDMMNKYLAEEVLGRHKPFDKEYRIVRKNDHKIRWVLGKGMIKLDKNNKVTEMVGTIQDITERKLSEGELEKATKLTKDIIDNTNSVIYMIDKKGRFLTVNKKFEKLFGVSRDQILGKTRADIVPLNIAKQHRKNDLMVLKEKKPITFDETNLEKDGEHFYLSQKFPVTDLDGNVYAVAGISEDITFRRNLEKQNEENVKQLYEAQKISKIGSFSLDLKTNKAILSDALIEIYGLPNGMNQISNEKFLSIIHPEDKNKVIYEMGECIKTRKPRPPIEYRIILVNGKEKIILATSRIAIDKKGDPITFFGTAQDITERKLVEEKIKKREELFHSIVSSINEGIIMNDKKGKVLLVNPSAEKILGQSTHDLVGTSLEERRKIIKFIHVDGTVFLDEEHPANVSLKTGKSQRDVILGVSKSNGDVVWISINTEPLFSNSDPEPYAVVATFRDISHEREIEKIRVDFLSLVSHQLRTPLSGTKWLIETMQRGVIGETNQKEKEYLNSLYQINERMISLVADILNVLTLESGVVVAKKEKISVRELYKDIFLIMEPAAKSKNINLINKLVGHKEFVVKSDFLVLRSILENFISNSLCYSASGQKISLDVVDKPNEIVFCIKDYGIGIPIEEQGRIFERFYRGSNAKMVKPSGTGLGLYTSALLARRIEAQITFESKEGEGTTFYLHVPKNNGM